MRTSQKGEISPLDEYLRKYISFILNMIQLTWLIRWWLFVIVCSNNLNTLLNGEYVVIFEFFEHLLFHRGLTLLATPEWEFVSILYKSMCINYELCTHC